MFVVLDEVSFTPPKEDLVNHHAKDTSLSKLSFKRRSVSLVQVATTFFILVAAFVTYQEVKLSLETGSPATSISAYPNERLEELPPVAFWAGLVGALISLVFSIIIFKKCLRQMPL